MILFNYFSTTTGTSSIISPIGEKDSDTRKRANDLFDLIIEPALEKYDFGIVRADKISSVASITSEIVELVQNADLCLIDITGHNPNVMYECGRRHETGRPYIMVASEGEKLPFDINTIRTIFYNTSSGRDIRNSVLNIQAVVDKMITEGFKAQTSGESLASISDGLKRIERRLEAIAGPSISTASAAGPFLSSNVASIIKKLGGPVTAFNYALTQDDVALAEALMPRLKPTTPHTVFVKSVLAQTAAMGSRSALLALEEEMKKLDAFSEEDREDLLRAYVHAVGRLDEEAHALEILQPFFEAFEKGDTVPEDMTSEAKAQYLNLYEKLLWGADMIDEAIRIGEKVIALCPNEPAYYYNMSINYEQKGDMSKTCDAMDKCLALQENSTQPDDDHLRRAVEVYAKCQEAAKCRRAYERLQGVNPLKASMLVADEDVQRLLGL